MTAGPIAQKVAEAAQAVRRLVPEPIEAGIILGTGLGALAERIEASGRIDYQDLPHFPRSTVEGHAGRLLAGTLSGRRVLAMEGRFHLYEGYSLDQITLPVRLFRALGAHTLITSCASGGMNPQYELGDIVLVEDHINLMGVNPLIGPNDDALGPRFPDMCAPYSKALMRLAEAAAMEEKIRTHRGVYAAVSGPNLETRAEYRYLRAIGADVVGMSTVPEVIVAVHAGLEVASFAVVTDLCFPDALEPVDIRKILAVAAEAEPKLTKLVAGVVEGLTENPKSEARNPKQI